MVIGTRSGGGLRRRARHVGHAGAGAMRAPRPLLRVGVAVATLLSAAAGVAAGDVRVRASLDRTQMQVGEQAVLAVEVEGSAEVAAPSLERIDGLSVRYLGPATQFSISQNRVSQSVTHRYALVAERAGRFAIGPIDVRVGGATYRADPVVVEVGVGGRQGTPDLPGRRAGEPDLALALEVPRREVFLHERVSLTLILYVGAVEIDDLEQPSLEGDAFSLEPFGEPVRGRVTVGGRPYRTLRFDTAIVPLRPGAIAIGPAVERMSVLVRQRHADPFFDRFFGGGFFTQARPYELRSNAETLAVHRLPDDGRPADFSGAIGRFDLEVSVQPVEVRANDPVTVTMRISGTGNLSTATPPRLEAEAFRTYPPQAVKTEEGLGRRVFEQVVIPERATVREIPPLRFSYFDPEARAYRTVTRGPIPLVVHPAADSAPASPGGTTAGGVRAGAQPLGQDIVYIKDEPGRLRPPGVPLGGPALVTIGLAPLGFYLAVLGIVRRRERLHGDPRYARFVQAGRRARRAIAAARRRAEGGEVVAAYDDLARALREYLSDKLDVPPGAVDVERIGARLGDAGGLLVRRLEEFFARVEHVRYARGADGDDGRAALDAAEAIVRDLERHRGLSGGPSARADAARALVALLVVLSVAGGAAAERAATDDPRTTFFEANTLYRNGRYAEAASRYEAIRAAGLESGALNYNLGNAYFKGGALGRAILGWERARCDMPRDPDVKANLRFARRQASRTSLDEPAGPPAWLRLLVPLAFVASVRELVTITATVYMATLLLLTLRVLLPAWRPALGRMAIAAGIATMVTGTALGVGFVRQELVVTAVVVRGPDTTVRFEPSETGTVHFSLGEGAVVRVLDTRDGWRQVARADGRRGWVEAAALESL
jgi:hypothetical protein